MLIDRGADVNMVDNQGRTALDIAREHGHDTIVAMLQEVAAGGR